MFVRFRKTGRRLQVSLVASTRIAGKVQPEHIAAFGTIDATLSVADRIEFWRQLHARLGQLSNRVDAATQAKLLGDIQARIPMVTADELRALQLQNAEADRRFWSGLRDMHAATVEDNQLLLATVKQAIATAEDGVKYAGEKADAAKERASQLEEGEMIAGGIKPLTADEIDRIFREAGWTAKDVEHARIVHYIVELGGFNEYFQEVCKRQRRAEYAAARAVLKKQRRAAGLQQQSADI